MPELDILFFIIIVITVLSISFSIAAWIFLANISSKTNLLEREIEKRSLEFDTLKKERLNERHPPTGASVIESTEPIPDNSNPTIPSNDTIQIFRNVRGTFEHSVQSDDIAPVNNESVQQESSPNNPTGVPSAPARSNMMQPPAKSSFVNESSIPPPPPTTIEQIQMPPIDIRKAAPGQPVTSTAPSMTLPLYSDVTKDADFQTLWKKITTILQTYPNPQIVIDLSGIIYLYEKEMDYLEKINYLICNQGGSLTLINCEKDLLTLINRKQHLGSIVTL
jgi:hypothetical protein